MNEKIQQKITDFLIKESSKEKIIVIYGPTASGKTSLSLEVANMLETEIISTDSRQIFRGLDIGTGKILPNEMQGIKHHMLDFLSPASEYSVGEYAVEARKIINELHTKKKIPVLCGGTGLYIDALIYDFSIPKIPADEGLRSELEQFRTEYGNEALWKELEKIDPEYARELHPNNYRYVMRAIEVKKLSGKSKTAFRTEKKLRYETLFLTPYNGNREALYDTINTRVEQMFEAGLVKEVQELLKKYDKNDFLMRTIGYREVVSYLEGEIDLVKCKALVKQHNRNYAKRQLTWFRRYEGLKILQLFQKKVELHC